MTRPTRALVLVGLAFVLAAPFAGSLGAQAPQAPAQPAPQAAPQAGPAAAGGAARTADQ